MESAGTYKITRAGQITIPSAIREELEWGEGDNVDFYYGKSMVILRKTRTPLEVFEDLAKETQERFKREGITRDDVDKVIKEVRDEMRHSGH